MLLAFILCFKQMKVYVDFRNPENTLVFDQETT